MNYENIMIEIKKINETHPLLYKLRLRDKFFLKSPFMFKKNIIPEQKNRFIFLIELLSGYKF